MSGQSPTFIALRGRVATAAPWLLAPDLGAVVVGTTALRIALELAGAPEGDWPIPGDLDMSWLPDVPEGQRVLEQHGVLLATTEGNQERGTLAFHLGSGGARERIEITTLRAGEGAELTHRITADLGARDMTIGAVAIELAPEQPGVHDPFGGVQDWRTKRIAPVGDPAARIAEHPVRWLRYYRKAHTLGFQLDPTIRKTKAPWALLRKIPREAVAAEMRAALLDARCPGALLMEWYEARILGEIAPELAPQFDGRPAGPIRHHPEISQALHMVLTLRWAAATLQDEADRFDPDVRARVMVATLCHDLGKGNTRRNHWPSHHGHEQSGLPLVDSFLKSMPGLTDKPGRRLARDVCAFHLEARRLQTLKPATLARRYQEHFRDREYPVAEFALCVAADSAGRLGREAMGSQVREQVTHDLQWLRSRCASVDAGALRQEVEAAGGDMEEFQRHLLKAQAAALRGGPPSLGSGPPSA